MKFYSYLWLRKDGSPYYAGKGSAKRAFVRGSHNVPPPKDFSRILVFSMASEADAIESEIALIELFGRKDIGTGCLRNFTDGGDGISGLRHSVLSRRKMSAAKKGRPSWNKGRELSAEHRKALSEAQKKRKDSRNLGKHWKLSSEARQAIANGHRGIKFSAERREKLSRAALLREAKKRERKCQTFPSGQTGA
jgi:hypothetical protein